MSEKSVKAVDFKFKDSGVSVKIRRVSPLLAQRVTESFPKPKPPMQEVDYGDGIKKFEANLSHPDYIEALRVHEIEYEHKIQKMLIELGVEFTPTDENKQEIEEMRQYMKDEMGIDLSNESDKYVYISYIACSTQGDLTQLLNSIISYSQPTEEGVQDATQSFQSDH